MPSREPSTEPVKPGEHLDRFLSDEDLDLKNLSWEELLAVWNAWLRQAAATDKQDAAHYSHGVFTNTTEPQ